MARLTFDVVGLPASGGGKSVFFADCAVLDEDGRVIGSGQGTFKYITLRS